MFLCAHRMDGTYCKHLFKNFEFFTLIQVFNGKYIILTVFIIRLRCVRYLSLVPL
jgi:hypothetical protein